MMLSTWKKFTIFVSIMKNNNINSNARLQSGMTLVEIMIAMSITLFMLAGVIGVYASSKQVYRVQKNMSQLQENSRFALDYLAKNIRMAGYVGCQSLQPGEVLEDVVSGATVSLENDFEVYKYDGINWNDSLPGTADYVKSGSDILTVKRGEVVAYPLVQPMANKADTILIGGGHLENGEVVLISNCSTKEMFTVSDVEPVGDKDSIAHATLQNRYGDDSDGDGWPNDNAVIIKFSAHMYYIRDEGNSEYALHRRDMITGHNEEMVEGVEDMQIVIDNDNPSEVEIVTVNLIMRSLDNGVSTKQATATDKYMHKAYSITINRRN